MEKEKCVHHWKISRKGRAVCSVCGETKQFPKTFFDAVRETMKTNKAEHLRGKLLQAQQTMRNESTAVRKEPFYSEELETLEKVEKEKRSKLAAEENNRVNDLIIGLEDSD